MNLEGPLTWLLTEHRESLWWFIHISGESDVCGWPLMTRYQGEGSWKCFFRTETCRRSSPGCIFHSLLLLHCKSPLPTSALTIYPLLLSCPPHTFHFLEVFSHTHSSTLFLWTVCLMLEMSQGVSAARLSPYPNPLVFCVFCKRLHTLNHAGLW